MSFYSDNTQVKNSRTLLPIVILILVIGTLSGCAAAVIGLDAVIGGIGIYQRYEDRQAQKDQTAEIMRLREELARHRSLKQPAPF